MTFVFATGGSYFQVLDDLHTFDGLRRSSKLETHKAVREKACIYTRLFGIKMLDQDGRADDDDAPDQEAAEERARRRQNEEYQRCVERVSLLFLRSTLPPRRSLHNRRRVSAIAMERSSFATAAIKL